jgi:hypothetical protein
MEGQPKTAEDSDRIINKSSIPFTAGDRVAVITFGRFQPPHLGHKKMIDYVYRLSKKQITPDEIDMSGDDTSGKIIVAKKYIMKYTAEVERTDPPPKNINILEELRDSGGFEGEPYVFLSRNKSKIEDKNKLYNPPARSRAKKMTFVDIITLLNKPSKQLNDTEIKLKEKIKSTLSNPLDPEDKIKLMKLQYYDYADLKIIDPTYFFEEDPELTPNKNIQIGDIVPALLKNNYNKIVIVIGSDRQDAFDFVAKSAQKAIPPEIQTAELIIVAIGRDLEGSGLISGLSASKVRTASLNIDIDMYDDPKNDDEKERLMSYLIPEDAPDEIKEKAKQLLPSFVKKIHDGYKPTSLSGGKQKRNKNTRKKRTIETALFKSHKKSVEYRLTRKSRYLE